MTRPEQKNLQGHNEQQTRLVRRVPSRSQGPLSSGKSAPVDRQSPGKAVPRCSTGRLTKKRESGPCSISQMARGAFCNIMTSVQRLPNFLFRRKTQPPFLIARLIIRCYPAQEAVALFIPSMFSLTDVPTQPLRQPLQPRSHTVYEQYTYPIYLRYLALRFRVWICSYADTAQSFVTSAGEKLDDLR